LEDEEGPGEKQFKTMGDEVVSFPRARSPGKRARVSRGPLLAISDPHPLKGL